MYTKLKSEKCSRDFKTRPGTKKYNLERLYHRDYADMPADRMTKDRLVLKQGAAVGQLKGTIYHYSYLSLSHQVSKLNRFTDQVLQTAVAENKNMAKYAWRRNFSASLFAIIS